MSAARLNIIKTYWPTNRFNILAPLQSDFKQDQQSNFTNTHYFQLNPRFTYDLQNLNLRYQNIK